MHEPEFDVVIMELGRVGSATISSLQLLRSNDLDDRLSGTMAGRHFAVHLLHCLRQVRVSVFLVHIMSATSRVVSHPHAKVLDVVGIPLENLVNGDNFAVGSLDLLELRQEIPKTRSRHHRIGSKDLHPVDLAGLLALLDLPAASHFVQSDRHS